MCDGKIVYWVLYFRINANTANAITMMPNVGSVVVRFNPIEEKLRKSPVSAVMAKLSTMEKVVLSIMSIDSSRGNRVWVRQYPGKTATRMKANTYRM